MLHILILGGTIVDGTGRPGFRGDLGIADDRIVFIGKATEAMIQSAGTVIHAEGKVVSPGFIDCHTHSDLSLFTAPDASARLYGGVTTEIAGNCGVGVAPISEEYREDLKQYFLSMFPIQNTLNRPVFAWNTFDSYLCPWTDILLPSIWARWFPRVPFGWRSRDFKRAWPVPKNCGPCRALFLRPWRPVHLASLRA